MSVSDTPGHWPTSHLPAADAAFVALTRKPDPLTLDCDSPCLLTSARIPACRPVSSPYRCRGTGY